ncbi:hypothetical protein BHE74_00005542 [Ensete ventricosum]|nr:hypothetical protein BHE74_00005542 [Ensete ventricosum]
MHLLDGHSSLIQSPLHPSSCYELREMVMDDVGSSSNSDIGQDWRRWFGDLEKRDSNHKQGQKKAVPPRSSLCVEEKVSDLLGNSPCRCQSRPGSNPMEIVNRGKGKR